ncbi:MULTISPECIES: phosphotransferase [Paenibacillus]|uniref:phosphotransferase n=1 Tax=Paenibacillus TaxID=44249 RepID=UPI00119CF5F7|nr:phosphotransferase [Paenibacillus sp. IHBB 10380]
MSDKSSNEIIKEISEHINTTFGFKVRDAIPVLMGYANLKWKVHTGDEVLFVKQYNEVRYPEELLSSVEAALGLQDLLHSEGIPCPKLFSKNDLFIQRTPSGERFIVTEYCEGELVKPGEVNADQMYHLGQIVGRMHKILYSKAPQSLTLHWKPESKEAKLQKWAKSWHEAVGHAAAKYVSALEIQRKIIDKIDLDLFKSCEEGWVHWDLFVDNLLFHDHCVSSILDFDRMHYIYPEFDISRAILSGTLLNGNINMKSVNAFICGYTESMPITVDKFVRSIKLTWWKECSWINIKSENHRTLKRFVDELIWVGQNWTRLEEIFQEIEVTRC